MHGDQFLCPVCAFWNYDEEVVRQHIQVEHSKFFKFSYVIYFIYYIPILLLGGPPQDPNMPILEREEYQQPK